ncbi:DNA-3-methyladenine glycosylase 2 family protein [Methanosarcinaceae archaeon]|nr:DNA-3-methyladenine glycosylase 2 family protein [Methanosarcinaceae archaeon]
MIKITTPYFNIRKIEESGQCFRFEKTGEGVYDIVSGNRAARVSDDVIECDPADNDFWARYFAFDDEQIYRSLSSRIDQYDGAGSGFVRLAEKEAFGIRILRQDPWETLISFIISQNNNIPRIKKAVNGLCEIAGDTVRSDLFDREYFLFPTAEQILECRNRLSCLRLGYREEYLIAASGYFAENGYDGISSTEKVLKLKGVGPKVAACYGLFGLHELNAFPVDTWIRKILQKYFGGDICFLEQFPEGKGILQQYMFYAERMNSAKKRSGSVRDPNNKYLLQMPARSSFRFLPDHSGDRFQS